MSPSNNLTMVWSLAMLAGVGAWAEPLLPPGNGLAGEKLAMQGGETAFRCYVCHGINGEGQIVQLYASPRLAGSSELYLSKQLRDYKSGNRPSSIMHRLAIRLSPKQIADVAAYYAALELPVLSTPQVGSASVVERGRTLAQQGDVEKNIPACANCHGLAGVGTGPMLPALAGQPFDYLQMQLHAWKHETRKNDDGGLMRAVAAKLSDQDIDATAHYYSRVQPLLAEP